MTARLRPRTLGSSMSFYVPVALRFTPANSGLVTRASQFGDAVILAGRGVARAVELDASVLLALDVRWLAKQVDMLCDVLRGDRPVVLVLAHAGDPLELGGVAANLRRLVANIPDVSVIRCDHGGLVAAACGDGHTSIGLSTSTRHFVAATMSAHRSRDRSPRVFVRALLDWFKGSELAGWDAARVPIRCHLRCCGGRSLGELYFDEDSADAALWHNMNAIADFADHIVNTDPTDRPAVFREACNAAVTHYGLAGVRGPAEVKRQLQNWAFS